MLTTSQTLLQKLKEPNPAPAWERFVDLYTPFLLLWARRQGLQPSDAADLAQEVFAVLLRKIDKYDADKGRFRTWLRTVCHHKWCDRRRSANAHLGQASPADLAELEGERDLDQFWEDEHNAFLIRRALVTFAELRTIFAPQTVDMCIASLIDERSGADVARQFGVTANAVRLAKLKVLRRLRQELAEFLD